MKKTILILATFLLGLVPYMANAQKIQYKETSIQITNNGGFSTTSNEIRYLITSNLSDADTLEFLFPTTTTQFKLKDGALQYGSVVMVNDMWDIISTVKIEASDVDKTVKSAIIKWTTNMMYSMDLLQLKNYNNWAIKE